MIKVIFDLPYVYTFIWTCTYWHLIAWMDFIHIQYSRVTSQCPASMSITVPKIGALQMSPQINNGDLLKNTT
jgi:hypothetical protein